MVSSRSKLQGKKKEEGTNRLKETSELFWSHAMLGPYLDPNLKKKKKAKSIYFLNKGPSVKYE